MGLLVTPTPQTRLVARVTTSAQRCFNSMLTTYAQSMAAVWQNVDGLTPQQAFDALGTSAGQAVQLLGLLVATVNSATPGTLPVPDPTAITVNQDGTVTVNAPVAPTP